MLQQFCSCPNEGFNPTEWLSQSGIPIYSTSSDIVSKVTCERIVRNIFQEHFRGLGRLRNREAKTRENNAFPIEVNLDVRPAEFMPAFSSVDYIYTHTHTQARACVLFIEYHKHIHTYTHAASFHPYYGSSPFLGFSLVVIIRRRHRSAKNTRGCRDTYKVLFLRTIAA